MNFIMFLVWGFVFMLGSYGLSLYPKSGDNRDFVLGTIFYYCGLCGGIGSLTKIVG